ncbi:MAG: VOC family protein [Pseudomonadota bacterium]
MTVLQVTDLERSIAFYARLGFFSHGTWGAPPSFAIVQTGAVTIALDRGKTTPPLNQWWAAYIYVEDAEALRQAFVSAGIEATEMNRPTDYGCMDFDVIDPDGHRIAFGQALNPVPGPGLQTPP